MRRILSAITTATTLALLAAPLAAQSPQGASGRAGLSQAVRQLVSVDAPVVALTHVRLVDGTGAPAG